jgi:hypothetical protein
MGVVISIGWRKVIGMLPGDEWARTASVNARFLRRRNTAKNCLGRASGFTSPSVNCMQESTPINRRTDGNKPHAAAARAYPAVKAQ